MTFAHRARRFAIVAAVVAVLAIAAGPALAAEPAVSIVDKSFQPAEITVHVGDTVTWTVTKSMGEPHSVTAGSSTGPSGLFDSGIDKLKDNGQTFTYTFEQSGEVGYFCSVHPTEMSGKVLVLDAVEGEGAAEEDKPPVAAERKVLGAGILAVTLVILFGAAWVWRRMNPA